MQRHVHVCVCMHSSIDTFLAAPHQLESDQLPCSILAPRSAQKKLKLASAQKPSISMQKMHMFSLPP